MRTLIVFLALCATATATPCDDARKDFNRAKRFGAHSFECVDRYDGTATSSWRMSPESFKRFNEAEIKRRKRK